MKSLICPISDKVINQTTARVTGFLMALMILLYIITGNIIFVILMMFDFYLRAFTGVKFSPFTWLANKIVLKLKLKNKLTDHAPKVFAARVGFIFAIVTTGLFFIHSISSLIVAVILMGFALLESVFGFCVGCIVYNYLILPMNKSRKKTSMQI